MVLVGETLAEPEFETASDQSPPVTVHEAAFVTDQVSVVSWPELMWDGLADNVTTGVGATVTVLVTWLDPPGPVQESV